MPPGFETSATTPNHTTEPPADARDEQAGRRTPLDVRDRGANRMPVITYPARRQALGYVNALPNSFFAGYAQRGLRFSGLRRTTTRLRHGCVVVPRLHRAPATRQGPRSVSLPTLYMPYLEHRFPQAAG